MTAAQTTDENRPLLSGYQQNDSYDATPSSSGAATPIPANKNSDVNIPVILFALWSAVFLGALDTTIVATLLTSIGSYYDSAHESSYLGSAYLLSVCCFTPLYGRLSDILGRKGAMLVAQCLFTSGTLLCGLAPSMKTLIAARAIAGMGGGGVMTVSSITCTDLIPLKQRGLYQGLANILFGLGAGLGGPLGGYINDHFGWQWAFLFQVPLLAISIILVSIFVNVKLPQQAQTTKEKLQRIDYLGSLTLVFGVGGLLLAVTLKSAEELPWKHPLVWGLSVISAVSMVAFVAVEALVAKEPIMPLRLLKQRTPLAVAITNFLVSVIAFSMLYNVPIYFTTVALMSAESAGVRLLPNAVALASGSVAAGFFMRHTGKFYYFTLLSGASCVLSSLLIAAWNPSTSPYHFWIDIVFSGFGGSAFITTTLIALIAAVGRENVAVATGISYLFRTTGQVIGVALSGAILQTVLLQQLRQRITGPGSAEIIRTIRHSTTIIPSLEPDLRQAAVESYGAALKAVFIFQGEPPLPTTTCPSTYSLPSIAAVAALAFIAALPIEENPLPGSHEEQELHDERRRQRQASSA